MRTYLSFDEAQREILATTPVLAPERVATRDGLGRVLAEPVLSTRTLPPADCSAMDGYAVRAADLAGACRQTAGELQVVYEVAAGGQAPRPLEAGQAARIFTGAPVPPGADAVVIQEDTEREGDRVRIFVEPPVRDNIREAGEDLQLGDRVLEAGHELRAPELGLLAALGRSAVAVHQAPRVAILSSGDELVEPDGEIAGGRIVSSNSYTLAAQCREVGAEPVYLGIARDRPEELAEHLRAGLRAECLVSSAGVSVGDHDYVRPALEKLGCRLHFWGVAMKPGFPVTFASFDDPDRQGLPLVFGLPGNPVSACVTFEQFVRPALRKMMGHRALFRTALRARLTHPLDKKAGRLHFVRVCLERRGDDVLATSTGNQSSGVLRSLTLAQGLLVFPAEATHLAEGESAVVQVVDEGFFSQSSRGF
jgi:molybdopterin molybdotransferase